MSEKEQKPEESLEKDLKEDAVKHADPIEEMSALLNPKRKYNISAAVAFNQLSIFLDYYEIDVKDVVIDQGAEGIETVLNRLIRAIRSEYLTISEENGLTVTQKLKYASGTVKEISYARVAFKHKRAMDNIKGSTESLLHFAAALTNIDAKALAKMHSVDMSIISRLCSLFMVV